MSIKDLKPNTQIKLKKLSKEEHKTQPPPKFSEVALLKTLADKGIGRPSTFSSIVSLIQDRGYVKKKGTQLYPTPLGFAVVKLLINKFPEFTAYEYTSEMEEKLDEIIDGKENRVDFLDKFWNGPNGFEKLLEELKKDIDWEEIEKHTTIELNNGYSIKVNRYGAFLQDNNGKPNDKGYLPSVKIDDDSDVEDFINPETNKELFLKAANQTGPRELGKLEKGNYKGWIVWAKDGKYGPFLQAINPDEKAKDKPINHPLPEDQLIDKVVLADIEHLFEEVKLPRTLNDNFFTGIGRRGPWLAYKPSAKSRRATFVSLPEELDPRTVSVEEAQKVWDEKQANKKK